MPVQRLAIVSIPVKDQNRAKAFYCDKLGFEVRRDNPMGPDQRWVELAPPGAMTSMTLVTWFDKMPAGSAQGLVLATEDIDALASDLRAKGVETGAIQSAPWGRYVTITDPDGNGLVLQQFAIG
jgi:catechol 2,3-dioxygenase-like lactoylglutathione lyase family enzyme